MQFSDTTNKDGIIQMLEFRTNLGDTGISGEATLLKQFTGQINVAGMRATSLIISADGIWEWDDSNMDNFPAATTNLISEQSDYKIIDSAPAAKQDWLEIKGVNIKDESGNWLQLKYRSRKSFGTPRQERETVTGTPTTYFIEGTQIFLDAVPGYNSTGGLEVLFNRVQLEFVSADTTKRPGFNTLFHEYLVLKPTYWWEKYKRVGDPEQTKRDIQEMEIDMAKFYNNRSKYEANVLGRATGRLK